MRNVYEAIYLLTVVFIAATLCIVVSAYRIGM